MNENPEETFHGLIDQTRAHLKLIMLLYKLKQSLIIFLPLVFEASFIVLVLQSHFIVLSMYIYIHFMYLFMYRFCYLYLFIC